MNINKLYENRLRFVLGEKYAGYYGYDAKGERVYKLTGTSGIEQVNAGYSYSNAVFDWCVMYPNPYIVITPKGYTKHYYAGAERIATVLGGGGFEDQKYPIVSLNKQHENDIINKFNLNYKNYDPFNHEKRLSDPLPMATTDGNTLHELDYQCNSIVLEHLDILSKQDMLLGIIKKNSEENFAENDVYYYHGDHIGSASWITETNGKPIQYIHYAPYGEFIDNQRVINYDEHYKFTGKERDAESGYDYFGARYYASPFSFWLSVDPLADKYPAISPYAYCTWNPVKFVDPDGKVSIIPIQLSCYIANKTSCLSSNKSNIKTAKFAILHPIQALQIGTAKFPINSISNVVSNFQVNLEKQAGFSKFEGNQGNAYRHTLWQAILTNKFCPEVAKNIGNIHEDFLPNDMSVNEFSNMRVADTMVDLLNNEIGRKIGINYKGLSNKQYAKLVLDEYKINGLWQVKKENNSYKIERIKLSQEQYDAALKVIESKGDNGLNIK